MKFIQAYTQTILLVALSVLCGSTNASSIENQYGEAIGIHSTETMSGDLFRRLTLQHRIDWNLPFNRAQLIGTHNSYSSPAYGYDGALNHYSDITMQLNAGMRVLNFDLILSTIESEAASLIIPGQVGTDIRVCHGVQFGTCYAGGERYLYEFLAEIRGWLDKNPNEVLVIQFEEALSHSEHTTAASLLKNTQYLGGKYFKPGDLGIWDFRDISKADVLSTGKNIVLTCGQCSGTSSAWDLEVFDIPSNESAFFQGNDWWKADYDQAKNLFVGIYESRYSDDNQAWLDGDELSWALHYKNLNIIGLDELFRTPRFDALVWSWGEGYPHTADECAVQSATPGRYANDVWDEEEDEILVTIQEELGLLGVLVSTIVKTVSKKVVTRKDFSGYKAAHTWKSTSCTTPAPIACAQPGTEGQQTQWAIIEPAQALSGHSACQAHGMVFRAPQSAFENHRLTLTKEAEGVSEVIINYRKTGFDDLSWKVSQQGELPPSILAAILL